MHRTLSAPVCAASRWPGSTDFCTGGKSADSVCDGSGNAATTINSGLSEAAVVSVAGPAAGSAAVATSALATAAFATMALAIAIACGSSAVLALAAREAARSSIGTAPEFSILAVAKPGKQGDDPASENGPFPSDTSRHYRKSPRVHDAVASIGSTGAV